MYSGIICSKWIRNAQVLQTMLPWISESVSEGEKDAMMDSIRQATKNTMFDQWLGAVKQSGQQQEPRHAQPGAAAAAAAAGGSNRAALEAVAEYLHRAASEDGHPPLTPHPRQVGGGGGLDQRTNLTTACRLPAGGHMGFGSTNRPLRCSGRRSARGHGGQGSG